MSENNNQKKSGNFITRHPIIWTAVTILVAYEASKSEIFPHVQRLSYSNFAAHIQKHDINDVAINYPSIKGHFRNGAAFETYMPPDVKITDTLLKDNVEVSATTAAPNTFMGIPIALITSIAPLVFLYFMARGIGRALSRSMEGMEDKMPSDIFESIGTRSTAKRFNKEKSTKTFKDVAGIDEAKDELVEIVEFLKDPERFKRLGGKMPKGVLLYGPPGNGKTLLAKAVAGEAGVPFFSAAGSEFVEMFVGRGAARIRNTFKEAKKVAPCIIFIDEIDAIGGTRNGFSNSERDQTLNQLLMEMDGFEGDSGIILIGATNRMDTLDPALLRPGRFDRHVAVSPPDLKGREAILAVHTDTIPMDQDVEIETIARGTPGFSGADLANLANEATLIATRLNRTAVKMIDFEAAKDKVLMGSERRSLLVPEEERKLSAYHEAGHALIMLTVPQSDPLHKVSIMPRGRALGVTVGLPEMDKLSVSKTALESRLAILFGGREAERLIFGENQVTTGASSDILQATRLARDMVTQYGMSDLGSIYMANDDRALAPKIFEEQQKIIRKAEAEARGILAERREELHIIAKALQEHETLSRDEIMALLKTPAGRPSAKDVLSHAANAGPTVR